MHEGLTLAGRYRVGHCLAQGGMGEIYAGTRLGTGTRAEREVAIKVLQRNYAADPRAADGLAREAAFLAMLAHPHVVRLLDFGYCAEGAPFLILERLHGRDLGEVVSATGPISPLRLLPIVHRLCEALASAHEQGFVHGDIKPANVMLGRSPDYLAGVRLLDFGLARFFRSEGGQLCSSPLLGTPAYMAPELITGMPDAPDGRTDQFSLAALVYVALTGREPFAGHTPGEVLTRVRHDNPRPLCLCETRSGEGGDAEAEIERVVRRGMAKRPCDRYPTVRAFARALDRAIADWARVRDVGRCGPRPALRPTSGLARAPMSRSALAQAETIPLGIPQAGPRAGSPAGFVREAS